MPGWLFVIGEINALQWVLAERRMAFRAHVRTDQLGPGDPIVIYASRGCLRDRAQVAAIGVIDSPVLAEPVDVGGEVMPRQCTLKLDTILPERRGVRFSELVARLPLTRERPNWGPLLHRTIVALGDGDLEVIRAAVEKAALTTSAADA